MNHPNSIPVDERTLASSAAPRSGGRMHAIVTFLRVSAFSLLCAAGLLAGGFGIFANHVSQMATPDTQPSADAIIVLTGGQSRLDAAMGLLKEGKGKRLLISGVHPSTGRNQLSAATGGDRQLFNCCVDIDRAALDTVGNAEESAKWVRQHDYDSVILVTNNYHMPRSLLEMSRLLGDAEVRPYPVVNTKLDNGRWLTEPKALRVLVTEYAKYVAALARGLVPQTQPESALASSSTGLRG